jgi:nucleoside-diphosphate-sugar epimerase
MRVLVTGHDGYIGHVLVPLLLDAGHEVVGLDSSLFRGCSLGAPTPAIETISKDVRDVSVSDLEGIDAVAHLAAVSNDPIGDLNPDCTYDINYRASVHTARMAKLAGVERFVFSSSCSLYGAGVTDWLDESAAFNPVTPYGESKVLAEEGIRELADERFSPTFLRNATAYGVSYRHRGDLVVNQLTAFAMINGEVKLNSDGSAWRPLVHIEDISLAILASIEAPREAIHNEAFNVGRDEDNFRIRDLAEMIGEAVPGSEISLAEGAGADKRSYRVRFDKIREGLPGFEPRWSVARGIEECATAYAREHGLTLDDFMSSRFQRIKRIRELQEDGRLDPSLRWMHDTPVSEEAAVPVVA